MAEDQSIGGKEPGESLGEGDIFAVDAQECFTGVEELLGSAHPYLQGEVWQHMDVSG